MQQLVLENLYIRSTPALEAALTPGTIKLLKEKYAKSKHVSTFVQMYFYTKRRKNMEYCFEQIQDLADYPELFNVFRIDKTGVEESKRLRDNVYEGLNDNTPDSAFTKAWRKTGDKSARINVIGVSDVDDRGNEVPNGKIIVHLREHSPADWARCTIYNEVFNAEGFTVSTWLNDWLLKAL